MSGVGSGSSDTVVRIEVYLDDGTEAVRVLTAPPFRFQLDTAELAEGAHTVRLVRIDAAGGRRERHIPFTVQHEPAVEVRGLEPGAVVSGPIDVDVVAPAAAPSPPPSTRSRGPSGWLYVLSTIIVLGGIWVFFMVVPIYSNVVSAPSASGGGATTTQAAGPPVDQALLKAGDTLYASDCAACHKPSGEGMPPTFPSLAGNSFLSDAGAVVKKVFEGGGSMPPHPSYTAKDLAAVATYIRNTWGNTYGGVSVADASSAEPSASNPSATPATGTATSTTSSPATGAATGTATSTTTSPAASTSNAAPTGQAAGAGTTALMSAGKTLYDSDCASCHQPNGGGMPPTFPALAGNANLADAAGVVQRVFDGKGTMPPHPSYTAKDLAAVATYVRNAFGNSYGPVTVQEASQAAPKAGQ